MYKRFQTLAYIKDSIYLVNNNKVLKYLMVLYLDAKISSPFYTLIAKSVLATLVTVDICHQFSNNQKCSRNSWKMHAPCYHNRILLHFQLKKFLLSSPLIRSLRHFAKKLTSERKVYNFVICLMVLVLISNGQNGVNCFTLAETSKFFNQFHN